MGNFTVSSDSKHVGVGMSAPCRRLLLCEGGRGQLSGRGSAITGKKEIIFGRERENRIVNSRKHLRGGWTSETEGGGDWGAGVGGARHGCTPFSCAHLLFEIDINEQLTSSNSCSCSCFSD